MQLLNNRFEIIETEEGFMVHDYEYDDYLHNETGDNCFNLYSETLNLINETLKTISN
jgi:hypothetical protein